MTEAKTTKIIPLKYPILIPEEKDLESGEIIKPAENITELKISRLKAKDLKRLPVEFMQGIMDDEGKVKLDSIVPLIAVMAKISEEAASEVDFVDMTNVAEAISDFLS